MSRLKRLPPQTYELVGEAAKTKRQPSTYIPDDVIDADTITSVDSGREDFLNKMRSLTDKLGAPTPSPSAAAISPIMAPAPIARPIPDVGRPITNSEAIAARIFRCLWLNRPEFAPITEPDIPYYAVGMAVKYVRRQMGWTEVELAQYLRLPVSTVKRVETAAPDTKEFTSPAFPVPAMVSMEQLARRRGLVKTALLLDSMTQAVIQRKQSKGRR